MYEYVPTTYLHLLRFRTIRTEILQFSIAHSFVVIVVCRSRVSHKTGTAQNQFFTLGRVRTGNLFDTLCTYEYNTHNVKLVNMYLQSRVREYFLLRNSNMRSTQPLVQDEYTQKMEFHSIVFFFLSKGNWRIRFVRSNSGDVTNFPNVLSWVLDFRNFLGQYFFVPN